MLLAELVIKFRNFLFLLDGERILLYMKLFFKCNRTSFLFLIFLIISFPANADEFIRIGGMGGAYTGVSYTQGGTFGNPAGLVDVRFNNLSAAFGVENLKYGSLPAGKDELLDSDLSFRVMPSIYYSGKIKGIGISLGYFHDFDNRNSALKIKNTKASYIVDERKFASDTETIIEYDLFREGFVALSMGYSLDEDLAIGLMLKYRYQTVKKGVIIRPLRLISIHGTEINPNDATKLIPAIIDNLDIEDAIERFKGGDDSREDVIADLSGGGFDISMGLRKVIYDKGNISCGFLLEHLLQQKIVEAQPANIRVGFGSMPFEWFTTAFDIHKNIGKKGLGISLGWEVYYSWQKFFSGGVVVRNGFTHEDSYNSVSIGLGVIFGGSQWCYTIIKKLDGSPIAEASHRFSSTTRF